MSIETGEASPAVASEAKPPKKKLSPLKRWLLIGGGALVLLFALAVADAYWQAYRTVDDLRQVADSLSAAKASLAKGRLPNGDPFTRAQEAVQRIRHQLDHARPTFGFVGALPFVGRPVVAVRKLLDASDDEVQAAIATKRLLNEMSGGALSRTTGPPRGQRIKCSQEPTPAAKEACKARKRAQRSHRGAGLPQSPLFSNGTLNVAELESFRPQLEQVVARLRAAEASVEAVPTAPFISKLTKLKEDILAQVSQVRRAGESALAGMKLIPQLFGQGGPRTYFVAFGDLSYIRGAGGSTLAFALLTVDHGKISITNSEQVFRTLDTETNVPVPVPADNWYLRELKTTIRMGNANYSPNFPDSALVMARIYEKLSGKHLDGLIQVDAPAVAEIMRATGPITVPAWPDPIRASDVSRIAYIDSHIQLGHGKVRKDLSSQMVKAAFQRIAHPRNGIEVLGAAVGLGKALAEKHVQIWLARPSEEAYATRLGWTGAIDRGPGDYLLVAEDSQSTDALAYFATQEVDHTVDVQSNGDLDVTTVLKMTSDVPHQYRVRPITNKFGGKRSTLVNLYAPADARLSSIKFRDSHGNEFDAHGVLVHTEAGRHVFTATMLTRAGKTTTLVFRYVVPNGLVEVGGGKAYELRMQVQPQINADSLHLEVNLPSGMHFGDIGKPFVVHGSTLTLDKTASRDFTLDVPVG